MLFVDFSRFENERFIVSSLPISQVQFVWLSRLLLKVVLPDFHNNELSASWNTTAIDRESPLQYQSSHGNYNTVIALDWHVSIALLIIWLRDAGCRQIWCLSQNTTWLHSLVYCRSQATDQKTSLRSTQTTAQLTSVSDVRPFLPALWSTVSINQSINTHLI